MSEDHSLAGEPNKAWYQTRIVLFIGGSIGVALLLVLISMALYVSSGAAQLDLSRPGYQSVQNKVDPSDKFKSFPASGTVNEATIDQFQKLYQDQVNKVTATDAFNPDVLSNQALGIDAPGVDQ